MNKLGCCQTRPDNVKITNGEQVSFAVFTAAFCFVYAKRNLIKFKLYNN